MRRRREEASQHTLEVFVMLIVMFASVASMTTFTMSGSSLNAIDKLLTTKGEDTLNVWQAMELATEGPCDPDSRLDKLVHDGLNGDHSLWDDLIEHKFGPGYDLDLVIDNYDAIYPLHGSGRVVGSNGIVDWTPDQTYTMPVGAVNTVSGTERMRVDVPAVHWGTLAKAKGEAVRYEANFTQTLGTKGHRVTWALTALGGSSPEPAMNVTWVDPDGPQLTRALTEEEVHPITQQKAVLRIAVGAAPAALIPATTAINITFPPGWHSAGWVVEALGSWSNESPPQVANGDVFLRAVADEATPSTTLQLSAYAPLNSLRPFDVITARLSHGSLAESNLVVTYPITSTDRSTPRVLAPTTPYGMRGGSHAIFGAAFANGGESVTIDEFTIQVPGGYDLTRNNGDGAPLFDTSFEPVESYPAEGWEVVSPKLVRWKADVEDPANQPEVVEDLRATQFWVKVRINSAPGDGTGIQPALYDGPNVTLDFDNGHEVTSASWGKSPGIVSLLVPPAKRADNDPQGPTSDGYSWSSDALLLGDDRSYTATARSVMATLERDATYTLRPGASDAVNLENAAANASFEVMTRKVPVGSRLRADGDLTSLLATLQQLGIDSELTLELYSPPSLGCKPTATWTIDTHNLPTPAILHTLIWDAGEPTPSVFATTDDGYLYRIDGTGQPVWATKLAGEATTLDKMDLGAGGQYLLVGTTTGKAQSLDAVEGDVDWTSLIVAGAGTSQPIGAAAVRYDAANQRVLAAAGRDIVALDPGDGHELAGNLLNDVITEVAPSAAGPFVTTATGYLRVSNDLLPILGTGETVAVTGLLPTQNVVIVVKTHEARVLDAGTLDTLHTIPFDREVTMTAIGHATSDAIEDIVAALGDHSLVVLDGATGTIAWEEEPPAAIAPLTPLDPFNTEWDEIEQPPDVAYCEPETAPASYATPYACSGDGGSELRALALGTQRTALAKRMGGEVLIVQRGDTAPGWSDLRDDALATSLHLGPWLTHAHAVAYGDDHGKITLYGDDGSTIFASEPSDRAGRFSFYMIVPEGGFYGSHILVAKLAWEVGNLDQEARLLDWFEVVGRDGTPATNPTYRVVLTVASRDAP